MMKRPTNVIPGWLKAIVFVTGACQGQIIGNVGPGGSTQVGNTAGTGTVAPSANSVLTPDPVGSGGGGPVNGTGSAAGTPSASSTGGDGAGAPIGPVAGGAGSGGVGAGGAVVAVPTAATVSIAYAASRLTNTQYLSTVHDLLAGLSFPDPVLPEENVVDNFKNAASGQTPTSLLIADYQLAAESIVTAIGSQITGLVGCQPTTTAAESTCARSFISSFGKKAYRRPLTDVETTRLLTFFQTARASDDFPTSMGSLVQLLLQSPPFLYRLEFGQATPSGALPGGLTPLTSYELATRLSYLFTNSMPDATLMAAADSDALQVPGTVEAQARRLLGDPRARAAVADFHAQWLQFVRMQGLAKTPASFPTFDATLAQALRDSTVRFVDHAFWELDSLSAFLTDTHAYVNDALAPVYGVTAPGSAALQLVQVDAAHRAGILTQAGLLAGLAGPVNDSPVKRGVLVLNSLLCQTPPPPPAGVNTNVPLFDPNAPSTTRSRLETQHAVGSCAGCHTRIDGIGFAFDHYDAVGQWRDQENGLPVDASAALYGTDVDGTFDGAVALGTRLAGSAQVARCISYHWLRYGLGLDTTQINVPAAQSIAGTFMAQGGSFTELLVAVATSDYFRSFKMSK
jgi:hypothetical protein